MSSLLLFTSRVLHSLVSSSASPPLPSCLSLCFHSSAPRSSRPSLYFYLPSLLSPPPFHIPSSSPLPSLMETSFMADSKCVCGVAHSSVREISAERITLAFSTNAVPWLTFDGEISRGCKFNHSGRFSVCVCAREHVCVPDHSLLECQQWPLIS